ncbi:B9 domain-containing protein 1 isoform X8 [Rattus norvegicus]|uniref:B9 domain-containing protein 1 isoform X8 n=1 Tax=Rattus norvegicus TaxID=10116 RepID=UPI002FD8556F
MALSTRHTSYYSPSLIFLHVNLVLSKGHKLYSACMDRTCLGMTWSEAMEQCMCPSLLDGTKGPSPCLCQSLHLHYRSSQAGSWDVGQSTLTPRWWPRVKVGKRFWGLHFLISSLAPL